MRIEVIVGGRGGREAKRAASSQAGGVGDGLLLRLIRLVLLGLLLLIGLRGRLVGLLFLVLLHGLLLLLLHGLLLSGLLLRLLLLLHGGNGLLTVIVIVAATDQRESGRADAGARRGSQERTSVHSLTRHSLPVVLSLGHIVPQSPMDRAKSREFRPGMFSSGPAEPINPTSRHIP